MLPLLQDDQGGYLRVLGASDILAIYGESSGHGFWHGVHTLIRISHRYHVLPLLQDDQVVT